MHFGVHIFPTRHSMQPVELAQEAEQRELESVWFSEHTHIPLEYLRSEDGSRLPDHYWQTYDVFVASGLAASATSTIQIGTGVSLVLQHHPINLAKAVATLDHVSGGRFIFGVGAGWLAPEMAHHGVSYPARYHHIDEVMSALKTIWSQAEPEFEGDFVSFSPIKADPKPLQQPHPPIISGGAAGPKSLAFVIDHCDGWMPILGNPDWAGMQQGISELRTRAQAAGRDPDSIEMSVFVWKLPDEATLDEMAEAGLRRVVLSLSGSPRDTAIPHLDRLAQLTAERA